MERFAREVESVKDLEPGKATALVNVILDFRENYVKNARMPTTCHTKMSRKLCARLVIILVWVNALVPVPKSAWLVDPDSLCMLNKDARYVWLNFAKAIKIQLKPLQPHL